MDLQETLGKPTSAPEPQPGNKHEEGWVTEERQRIADAIMGRRAWWAALRLNVEDYPHTLSHKRVDRLIARRRRSAEKAA